MEAREAKGLGILALLVVGAALGRASVEPVEVHPTETITKETRVEVPVPGPTVTVTEQVVPDVCVDMVRLARETNSRTLGALDLTMPMLDALEDARRGVGMESSAMITDADNQLRAIQSEVLEYLPQELGGNTLRKAQKNCEAALE